MKYLSILLAACTFLFVLGCSNEPIGEANVNPETLDETLLDFVQLVVDEATAETQACVEFNYTFTLFIFDENENYVKAASVASNAEFVSLLDTLPPDYSLSINYPISGTLNTGEFIEITNNNELRDAIEDCAEALLKRECDGAFVDCIWKVESLAEFPNDFEGAYYQANTDGSVQFHYNNKVFFGTWVTLYIGDDLYMNIDLLDDDTVESFWDANWKVNLLNSTQLSLSLDDQFVYLQKDCSIDCTAETFEQCELEDTPGVANFVLETYTPCISVPPTYNGGNAVTYTFYETREDAVAATNALDPKTYTNTENPQLIFVALRVSNSQELLKISEIALEAIPCE